MLTTPLWRWSRRQRHGTSRGVLVVGAKRESRHTRNQLDNQEKNKATSKARTYLLPFVFTTFKVGCNVESRLRHFWHLYSQNPRLLALQSATMQLGQPPSARFDLDLIPIGIDNHASRCMANVPHLFEDLHLASNRGQVDGIGKGLEIQGEGTFKFSIKDNNGRVHTINILNSLYLPDLRQCFLSSQLWVQEAGDGETWMGNFAHECVLNWKGGGKQFLSMQPPTHQYSSQLLPLVLITLQPQSLKPLKHPTSAGRLSSNSLGAGTLSMSLPLFLKSLSLKSTSTFART